MTPSEFAEGIEKRFQLHAGRYPALFFGVHALLRRQSGQAVGDGTEIVIEGFPRSANSFAVEAFRLAQRERHRRVMRQRRKEARREGIPPDEVVEPFRQTRIANNLHVPAQVMRASRLGVPALVLIRRPVEAIVSFQIRDGISAPLALKSYISFYETVEPYRSSFVVGEFDEVTRDFGAIIARVNERFGTDFATFRRTKKNVRAVFSKIDETYQREYDEETLESVVSRPSSERAALKRDLEAKLRETVSGRLLTRAESAYERLSGPFAAPR